MKVKSKVIYPCGFGYSQEFETGWFDWASVKSDKIDVCPLHGKNCKLFLRK